mmetsp:Transcript_62810/g.178427  ORF Transcript_62810/g.178427 Transcript_62810/m.178427 type:complete len:585 (+) Transcript_62810:689-2443(+)
MAVWLQEAILPAVGQLQARIHVAPLPSIKADHVCALVLRQGLVQRPKEGKHVDPLRAGGPVAAAQQRHLPGAVLQGRPDVLVGEGARAYDQDLLAPEVEALHLVAIAVADLASEGVRLGPVDLAPVADAPVDVEGDRFSVDLLLGASLHVPYEDVEGAILQLVDLDNLHIAVNAAVTLAGNLVDVPQDVAPGRVVLVGPAPGPGPVDDAVADLGRVHARVVVAVVLPDAADLVVLLQDHQRPPCLLELHGLVDAADARAHDDAVDLVRQGRVRRADVRQHAVAEPAAVLRAGLGDQVEDLRLSLDQPHALEVRERLRERRALGRGRGQSAEVDGLEVAVLGVPVPRRTALFVHHRKARVAQRADRHGQRAAGLAVLVRVAPYQAHAGDDATLSLGIGPFQGVGIVGLLLRPVARRKQVGGRAVDRDEGHRQVRRLRLRSLEVLQQLVGDQGAHAPAAPDGAAAVAEGQDAARHLLQHVVEGSVAHPADDPEVHFPLRLDLRPGLRVEGAIAAKLRREEHHSVRRRELFGNVHLRHNLPGDLRPRVLHRLLVAHPRPLDRLHLLGSLAEGVLEGDVRLLRPGPRA